MVAIQAAFDEISVETIPLAQRLRGVIRIEACDFVDSGLSIASQLFLPLGVAGVERARDLDGHVRSAAFLGFPGGKRTRKRAHADDQIWGQTLARIRRIPIHELVRSDRATVRNEVAHQKIKRGAQPVRSRLPPSGIGKRVRRTSADSGKSIGVGDRT